MERLIPIAVIARDGELPQVSARTSAIIRELDKLDARFESIETARYEEELAIANVVHVSPFDLLLETDQDDHAILWLYDHDARRIVCRGELNAHMATGVLAPGALASLRATRP
jgi:hypothetical protein